MEQSDSNLAKEKPADVPNTEGMSLGQSGARYNQWLGKLREAGILKAERLLPEMRVPVPTALPSLMGRGAAREGLVQEIKALQPWGYSIQLAPGVLTGGAEALERTVYRSHLISGAIREGLRLCGRTPQGATAVDFACNHGYFSLLAAELGFDAVRGFDLREVNLRKARLLADQFDLASATFEQRDVYTYEGQADVVLNLGLLYHVTDPVRLMELSFAATSTFCIVDTITYKSPVSAFILRTNKDQSHHAEGAYNAELHPTYRALIDLMHAAGFVDLMEVVPEARPDRACHPLYDKSDRRCLIGFRPGAVVERLPG
ncbi:class I SAM-dependent methyltransferase [Rhodobacteraceae bacterium N5(2021)]|uniref:Class I SAM-dependent methyltransferase n=1 Tax=Gymnodinialimonas phycosphaerae TaxID=2841589 RepID=A0A975TVZ3_9RHOB|nr:class I SAM-dependent methyltransferase [Gymnodinialimonas phycosphaerae]MBY4895089.1 class I SAM-dependent methyltransferase [Gymnodinialimonas phycosphaerae]